MTAKDMPNKLETSIGRGIFTNGNPVVVRRNEIKEAVAQEDGSVAWKTVSVEVLDMEHQIPFYCAEADNVFVDDSDRTIVITEWRTET